MTYYEKSALSENKTRGKKRYVKFLGTFFIIFGIAFFSYFFFPVASYKMFLANASDDIEVPIPKYLVAKNNNTGGLGSLITERISSLTTNYNDARNWYPEATEQHEEDLKVDAYLLSIPKLKIENAEVSTKDYDLANHLVQYFGTAIPGEPGTAIIFGHSTIPAWFNPKDYKTIFATLHTLKVGDEVNATVNGEVYKYKIFSMEVTTPEDTNMFSQSFDHSYITIVTCTPPGTIWKRLVVRAALES